jgi:hypothetical protein
MTYKLVHGGKQVVKRMSLQKAQREYKQYQKVLRAIEKSDRQAARRGGTFEPEFAAIRESIRQKSQEACDELIKEYGPEVTHAPEPRPRPCLIERIRRGSIRARRR